MKRISIALAIGLTTAGAGLTACSSTATDPGTVDVSSGTDTCALSATEAPSGNITFTVKNTGTEVTEFYLLGDDQLRIVGEVENIGPGLSRDLVVQAAPGAYYTACKPGMVGDGIRAPFTIIDSGNGSVAVPVSAELTTATDQYAAYVRDQASQLLVDTKAFAAAYRAGDDATARAAYADTRMHWERIEPVAEAFGDLDPKLDLREADLEPGQEWTGWHRIEKDLWPPGKYTAMTQAQRDKIADQLVADTQVLYDRTRTITFTPAELGNGAKELLDEVATGKVTGEEEAWSHTDLWDFQANVDGARVAYEDLRPVVEQKNPALAKQLDEEFTNVQNLLNQYKTQDGFTYYTELTGAQIRQLAAAVDALAEPLSKLTATVVQ